MFAIDSSLSASSAGIRGNCALSLLQSQGDENDTCTAIPLEIFNHDETDNYYQKFL